MKPLPVFYGDLTHLIALLRRAAPLIYHRNDCATRRLRTMFLLRTACTCGADAVQDDIARLLRDYDDIKEAPWTGQ